MSAKEEIHGLSDSNALKLLGLFLAGSTVLR